MKGLRTAAVAASLVLTFGTMGWAQQPTPAPPATPAPARPANASPASIIPLKVDVVLSMYKDDKKVSSTPYSLSVSTNTGKASIRMGAQVPMPVMAVSGPTGQPGPTPPIQPVQYKDVGTNIDCFAQTTANGGYRIAVTVEDTSVYPGTSTTPGTVVGAPTLRSFRSSNELVLRDGQSAEFTAATDKVSGETIRVEVKLTVLK